jgi:hypothetical protein
MEEKTWTVWVGGVEVNDQYLTLEEAENLRDEYLDEDYEDVILENTSE